MHMKPYSWCRALSIALAIASLVVIVEFVIM